MPISRGRLTTLLPVSEGQVYTETPSLVLVISTTSVDDIAGAFNEALSLSLSLVESTEDLQISVESLEATIVLIQNVEDALGQTSDETPSITITAFASTASKVIFVAPVATALPLSITETDRRVMLAVQADTWTWSDSNLPIPVFFAGQDDIWEWSVVPPVALATILRALDSAWVSAHTTDFAIDYTETDWRWTTVLVEQASYPREGRIAWEFTASASTDIFTATGHTLVNGDRVVLEGATLPDGVESGVVYFIVTAAANTFQLSTTLGGLPIDLTTDGTGTVVFNSGSGGPVQPVTPPPSAAPGLSPSATGLPQGVPTEVTLKR